MINNFTERNLFPDLVYMKLSTESSVSKKSLIEVLSFKRKNNPIFVKLTLRFGKQIFHLKGGSVSVGLKRGQLKLDLINSRIPLEKMGLIKIFLNTIEIERQQTRSQESEMAASATASATALMTAAIKTKNANQEADKGTYSASKIVNEGTESEPRWLFKAEPLVLDG